MIGIKIRDSLRRWRGLWPEVTVAVAILQLLFSVVGNELLEGKETIGDTSIACVPLHTKGKHDPGTELFKARRYSEAIDVFQKKLAHKPGNWSLHFNIGCSYLQLKQYNKAAESFKKVTQFKPEYEQAYYLQGVCYRVMGDNVRAKAAFQKVLDLNPKNQEALKQLEIQKLLEQQERKTR